MRVSRQMARFLSEAGAYAQRWAWEQGARVKESLGR